jgi:hypothetical protein
MKAGDSMKPHEVSGPGSPGWRDIGSDGASVLARHVPGAHATVKGEHQLSEHVARLGPDEGVEILVAGPEGLPSLAARRHECGVGQEEQRSFEDVKRTWTLGVLSGLEGG